MIKEIFPKTSRLFDDFHSIPITGTIYRGSGSEVDEEIILEGPYMSLKSYVDEEINLKGPDMPIKENVPKVITTASSTVSHFSPLTKVS